MKWRARFEIDAKRGRWWWVERGGLTFSTEARGQRYIDRIEALFKQAGLTENDVWTSLEQINETRWDCSTERLAAAGVTQ